MSGWGKEGMALLELCVSVKMPCDNEGDRDNDVYGKKVESSTGVHLIFFTHLFGIGGRKLVMACTVSGISVDVSAPMS